MLQNHGVFRRSLIQHGSVRDPLFLQIGGIKIPYQKPLPRRKASFSDMRSHHILKLCKVLCLRHRELQHGGWHRPRNGCGHPQMQAAVLFPANPPVRPSLPVGGFWLLGPPPDDPILHQNRLGIGPLLHGPDRSSKIQFPSHCLTLLFLYSIHRISISQAILDFFAFKGNFCYTERKRRRSNGTVGTAKIKASLSGTAAGG